MHVLLKTRELLTEGIYIPLKKICCQSIQISYIYYAYTYMHQF